MRPVGRMSSIVTVSRGSTSGGTALAERIARSLHGSCIAREVLVEAAAKLGVSEEFLKERMKRSPVLWERYTAERRIFSLALKAALVEHAARGSVVYHGVAGHLLLPEVRQVLRIRLIAPMAVRVRRMMEERGIGWKEAASFIERADRERKRWAKLMYGVDIEDPRLYDLVLNLEGTTLDSAAALAVSMAKKPEFLVDEEGRAALADLALSCRVRLALAVQPSSRGFEPEIEAHGGVVTIGGWAPRPSASGSGGRTFLGELRRTVEDVAGVREVVLDLRVAPV